MANDELRISRRTLQFRKAAAIGSVTRELLKDRSAIDSAYDQVPIRLETAVLSECIKTGTFSGEPISVPATWWDHWKQDRAPAWLRRKWPVRYRQITLTVELTRWAHYPEANLPLPNKSLGSMVIVDELESHTSWD